MSPPLDRLNFVSACTSLYTFQLMLHIEAMDRIHRLGQRRPVQAIKLIVEDSIESRIVQLQEKKSAMVDATLSTDESVRVPQTTTLGDIVDSYVTAGDGATYSRRRMFYFRCDRVLVRSNLRRFQLSFLFRVILFLFVLNSCQLMCVLYSCK